MTQIELHLLGQVLAQTQQRDHSLEAATQLHHLTEQCDTEAIAHTGDASDQQSIVLSEHAEENAHGEHPNGAQQ